MLPRIAKLDRQFARLFTAMSKHDHDTVLYSVKSNLT